MITEAVQDFEAHTVECLACWCARRPPFDVAYCPLGAQLRERALRSLRWKTPAPSA